MSAKARFLQKLEASRGNTAPTGNKGDADIAAFCQHMRQLQDDIEQWLAGSDLSVKSRDTVLVELLLNNRSFSVLEITVSLAGKTLAFTPMYLYGQGVTGCTEVSLITGGQKKPLYRLLMRPDSVTRWCYTSLESSLGHEAVFDEEAFFTMLESLLE